MTIDSLLNQTVTLYTKTGYDLYGRETKGSAQSVAARFVETTKSRLLPNQQVVTIEAMVFFKSDQAIQINDKVTYGGVNYKVHGKKVGRGRDGEAHHIECELIKWQT